MLRKIAFAALATLAAGCVTDYAIVAPEREVFIYETETVYEEVIVEVEVEVPLGDVWVDSFDQPNTINGIDIIWVIDRSGSMHDDAARITAGIEAMILALPADGWRLNIISADPNKTLSYSDGSLFFPVLPTVDPLDAVADANALFGEVAAIAAPYEQGFAAVHSYLTDAASYSYTWMRPEAALLVVFVSDEEEQSQAQFPSVSDFTSWYSFQRPPGATFLASIVNLHPDDSTCNGNISFWGERYIDATNSYAGAVVDICASDWSAGVVDATSQTEPYEEYELSHKPFPDTIRVFIDGSLSSSSDWHYDAARNVVVFDVIPAGGSLVEIGYVIQ